MEPIIEMEGASVVKDGETLLHSVSFKVFPGENIAILGPNGAGKSTLIKLITREHYPVCSDGRAPVKIYGRTAWDIFELRSRFGIVSSELQYANMRDYTGTEVLLSGYYSSLGLYDRQKITQEMLEKAAAVADFLGVSRLSDRYMSKMSLGEQRRFLIGRALVNEPQTLILDEPTSGLDIKAAHGFLSTLRDISSAGKNILLVTHRINEIIPEISRVILVKDGRVFLDGKKENALTSGNVSALYDMDLSVHGSGGYYWITYK